MITIYWYEIRYERNYVQFFSTTEPLKGIDIEELIQSRLYPKKDELGSYRYCVLTINLKELLCIQCHISETITTDEFKKRFET